MNSVEWRLKKLEDKILGSTNATINHVERYLNKSSSQDSIFNQLSTVAEQYIKHIKGDGNHYIRFKELYNKYKDLLNETNDINGCDNTSKAELILAYEDDLVKYFQDIKMMAETADRVLNIQDWPDLSDYGEKLKNLEKITKEQHLQSIVLDKRTMELIEIYNDIISSTKSNMVIWNNKIEAYENLEKKPEEDE